jgi:hypothetical protein
MFLWISQVARVMADWCLRMFAVLELRRDSPAGHSSSWYLVTAIFVLPSIFFAPLNGAISNSLPKRAVLTGSAAFCLAVLLLFAILSEGRPGQHALVATLLLVACGAAVYNPTRYALLPAAAQDTALPLTRVNGWIELGAAAGIVSGTLVPLWLEDTQWYGRPAAVMVAATLSLLGLIAAAPARFPSDVLRPEAPLQAVAGFFRDTKRILAEPAARSSLLGMAAFLALITAGSGAVVMLGLGPEMGNARGLPVQAMILVSIGAALGSWLAGRQASTRRCLGLVPLGAVGLLVALGWAATVALNGFALPLLPCLLLGIMGALANVPLRAAYQAALPLDARGNGMSVTNLLIYTCTTLLSVFMLLLARLPPFESLLNQLLFLAGLAGVASALAGWHWRGEVWELVAGGELRGRDVGHAPALQTIADRKPLPDPSFAADAGARSSDVPSTSH